jgi:hypothetical protein
MTINDLGVITLRKKDVVLDVLDPACKVCFRGSTLLNCNINDIDMPMRCYSGVLKELYHTIGDGTKIIKETTLNISTVQKNDKGFQPLPLLGISVQGAEATRCIQEIVNQCRKNTISIRMRIKLVNETEVIVQS